jgi:hypothetical protein
MCQHGLRILSLVGLAVVLGSATSFCPAAEPPEQTQRLKEEKPEPVSNVGDKANKIDNPDENLEPSTPEGFDPIGGGKFKIISKTFLPPLGKQFTTFPDGTWVDVQKSPDSLTIDKNVGNKNDTERIKVSATEAEAGTAGQFPMKCEGNLQGGGGAGAGTPPHWSAKVSGMFASESVTMTVLGQSSTGLAAGEKGEGGTSFEGAQVTITVGGQSGAGTLTVPLIVTWQGGPETYQATFDAPSLWVSEASNGIDATITLTNITVDYLGPFGGTDTGTMPDTTLTMKGGNTTGPVTGTWTSPATAVTLTFKAWGVTITIKATRTVTINAH